MNESQNKIWELLGKNNSLTHKKAKELAPEMTAGQIAGAIHKLKLDGKIVKNENGEYIKTEGVT